jgi:hypothetical protein
MDIEEIRQVAVHVIAIASIAAAAFGTPTGHPALIAARRVLDYCAFNFGGAKNQAQVEADKFKRKRK